MERVLNVKQSQVFTVEGHRWPLEAQDGSTLVTSLQIGPLEVLTIDLEGAGGPARLTGDYGYGSHREPYRDAGLWGLLRVRDPCTPDAQLRRLPSPTPSCGSGANRSAAAIALGAAGLGVAVTTGRRRRRLKTPG